MGQQNSKNVKERDDLEEEEENKIKDDIQKFQKKNERKDTKSNRSEDRNKRHEKKLYVADQETSQANKITEKLVQSSARLTETEPDQGRNENNKRNSHCDEAGSQDAIFKGTDYRECVNLHSRPSNENIVVGSALVESDSPIINRPETYGGHLYKESLHLSEENTTSALCDIDANEIAKRPSEKQGIGMPEAYQDDCGTAVDSICKEECGSSNRIKSSIARKKAQAIKGKLYMAEACSYFAKYLFKFDVLHLLYRNVIFKFLIDDIEHVRVSAYWYPVNRPVYEHVYAVRVNERPTLNDTFGDKQMIKYILRRQNLRERYLADEHFRLATFSLYELDYEKGEMLRLAGSGYFCDIDGRVKCFCCGNTYSPDFFVTHHPCTSRYSNRSIADNYGTSAANWLVQSRQNEEEEHRGREFIDIHLRITTTSIRLGRTQQIVQNDIVTQDSEESDNTDFISVRGSVNSTDESSHGANIDVSLQGNCEAAYESGPIALPSSDLISIQRQQDPLKGNQRRSSDSEGREASQRSTGHPGMCTVDQSKDSAQQATQNHVRGLPSDGQRTIKEDVNRKKSDDAAARGYLVMENAQFISRTLCCICRKRRRNIVFKPCGHLVVCDQCIINTTECPTCGNKVDTAHPTQDLSR